MIRSLPSSGGPAGSAGLSGCSAGPASAERVGIPGRSAKPTNMPMIKQTVPSRSGELRSMTDPRYYKHFKKVLTRWLHAIVLKCHSGGVEPACAVDTRAGMRRGRSEVKSAHRSPVTKVRENRAKEQLLVEMRAAAAQVSAHQVLIH